MTNPSNGHDFFFFFSQQLVDLLNEPVRQFLDIVLSTTFVTR